MLSLGDRRMSKALLEVWKRGGKFDGWSEHFSWERWTEALEAAGIPKERHLRQKDLKEKLPWDVVDASIRKPFLVVEWKKALQEMATEDCKWGHCTACGVPGNGEDTVLANGMPEGFTFALPSLSQFAAAASTAGVAADVSDARDEGRGSAYADKAKGAAYRMKATPDLLPLRERRRSRGGASESAAISKTWRVSFEKLGDARYLSHRNVMDILERAFRAARVPVRYTEGFNPHLRHKDLKETLPWDVVDASIRKPFLVVEWKKALQEMATDDCKWGHCTACGVPGNGEDTVLAHGMPEGFTFALPSLAQSAAAASSAGVSAGVSDARDEGRGSAYADKAKGAAYRMKATPDLLPLRERRRHRGGASESAAISKTWRVSFEKLGDARYLSHRNVMDILERAFRAARVPVRYTEGFNPHIRLSMGPALPLGQESRHELFDLDVVDTLSPEFLAAVNDRLPPGMRLLGWNELPAGARSLGKAATEAVYRFTLPNGEELTQRLHLAGEGATTPKRFIETTWGLAAEDQHAIRVVREETVLTPVGATNARHVAVPDGG